MTRTWMSGKGLAFKPTFTITTCGCPATATTQLLGANVRHDSPLEKQHIATKVFFRCRGRNGEQNVNTLYPAIVPYL